MTVPATMRFIDHGKGGAPSVLVPATGPVPQARDGEVLIRVAYAGVNRPDVLQRSGNYPPPPDASRRWPFFALASPTSSFAFGPVSISPKRTRRAPVRMNTQHQITAE